jgi:DNA primase
MAIDQRIIDEISAVTDIVQLIADYIPVKRAGANFKASCPFHQEKTASFMISPQKQIFHCFGCNAGGNVFSFLMKYENMTFPEAVRFLAEKANITIAEERGRSKEKVNQTRHMYDLFDAAREYYRQLYKTDPKAGPAREYIHSKRGFSESVSEQFGIGYATQEWSKLFEYLQQKGFSPDIILKSGLVMRSPKGTAYDFFRGRVLFPIVNSKDKTIGFGGRSLGADEPKYINTPETEFFRKRYELYGLNFARREIHAAGDIVIVVEGYLDVMALWQAGIKNAVAPLGTALSQDHVRLLRRYADKVILVFDGDSAGVQAALRSIDIVLEEELPAEVVALPKGYDPDSFVKEKGSEAFTAALTAATDAFDFKLQHLISSYSSTSSFGLMKIAREMLVTTHVVKNAILKDRYIKKLATRLRISETAIRAELMKKAHVSYRDDYREDDQAVLSDKPLKYAEELDLLYILITEPAHMALVSSIVEADDFQRKEAREIYLCLCRLYQDGAKNISLDTLTNHLDRDESKAVLSELAFVHIDEETLFEALQNRLRDIKVRSFNRKLEKVKKNISEAEVLQDDESRKTYQRIQIDLLREKQKLLSKDLGTKT